VGAGTVTPAEEPRPRIGALPPEITSAYVARLADAARPVQGPRDRRFKPDIARATDELAMNAGLRRLPREVEALAGSEAIAAEAHLRSGYSSLRLGDREAGLAQVTRAESLATDPALLYVIRVYIGSANEALGRSDDAAAAYRRALDGMPFARTAS